MCVGGGGGGGGGKFNSMGLGHSGSQLTKSENHLHTLSISYSSLVRKFYLLVNELLKTNTLTVSRQRACHNMI